MESSRNPAQQAPGGNPVLMALPKYDLLLAAVVLGILCVAVFGSVAGFEFQKNYDDQLYVLDNPLVRDGMSWKAFVAAFQTIGIGSVWAPVLWLSFQLDVALMGGLSSAGMHLENLAQHWMAGVLTYLVIRRLSGDKWLATVLVLLWSFSPLVCETVGWVTERKNTLAQVFFMAALWAYIRPSRSSRWAAGWTFVVGMLAMMVKSSTVILPIALLLADHVLGRFSRRRLLAMLPLFAFAGFTGVLTIIAEQHGNSLSAAGSIPLSLQSLAIYARQMFWPAELCYMYEDYSVSPWLAGTGALLLVGLLFAAWRSRHSAPLVTFSALLTLASLALVLGYPRLVGEATHADRFIYMPLLFGLLTVLALLPKTIVPWLSVLAVPLAVASYYQVQTWQSDQTRIEHGARYYPNTLSAIHLYTTKHPVDEAIRYVQEKLRTGAVRSEYARVELYYLLARLQKLSGQDLAAISTLLEVMREQPRYCPVYAIQVLVLAESYGLKQEVARERARLGVLY